MAILYEKRYIHTLLSKFINENAAFIFMYVTYAHITIASWCIICVFVYVCVCVYIYTILSYMQCSTIIVGVIIIIIIVSKGWARRAFNDYCASVYIICIVLSFECCKTKGGDGGGEGGQMKLHCHRADPFSFGIVRSCFYISKHLLTHTHIYAYI